MRTLCPEAVEALHRAGLFGLWVPREAGGFDADVATQLEALVELARADMSACWTVMIGNTVTASMAAKLPDDGFGEVFAGQQMPVAAGSLRPGGRAERTVGGYRVTGRWGFGSGICHADWIVANCLETESGQERGISLAIPIAEVRIDDDWHVAGLCGTGSCSYAVADVLVPERRAMRRRQRGTFLAANPGYRIPVEHAAVSLGGARRALDETIRSSATKHRLWDPEAVAARQSFRVEIGKLEAQWTTLMAGTRACAVEVDRAGKEHLPAAAARLRAVAAHAAEQGLAIGGRAFRYAGAAAIRESDVQQRVQHDLAAAAQHVMVSDSAYEAYAETILSASPIDP